MTQLEGLLREWVCVQTCIYVYVHTACVQMCTHVYDYTEGMCMQMCIHLYMHTEGAVCKHAYMCTCTQGCACKRVYMRTCTQGCACKRAYICTCTRGHACKCEYTCTCTRGWGEVGWTLPQRQDETSLCSYLKDNVGSVGILQWEMKALEERGSQCQGAPEGHSSGPSAQGVGGRCRDSGGRGTS